MTISDLKKKYSNKFIELASINNDYPVLKRIEDFISYNNDHVVYFSTLIIDGVENLRTAIRSILEETLIMDSLILGVKVNKYMNYIKDRAPELAKNISVLTLFSYDFKISWEETANGFSKDDLEKVETLINNADEEEQAAAKKKEEWTTKQIKLIIDENAETYAKAIKTSEKNKIVDEIAIRLKTELGVDYRSDIRFSKSYIKMCLEERIK